MSSSEDFCDLCGHRRLDHGAKDCQCLDGFGREQQCNCPGFIKDSASAIRILRQDKFVLECKLSFAEDRIRELEAQLKK